MSSKGKQPVKHRLRLAPLAVGTFLGLAACGAPSAVQQPQPQTETSTATTTKSSPPSTSTSKAATPLASLDPCKLLTESQRQKLGVPRISDRGKVGTARSCTFQNPVGADHGVTVGVSIREHQGLKDFTDTYGEPITTTVSGRKAKLQHTFGTHYMMGIYVTESSRVDVQAIISVDDAAEKRLVKKAAAMVVENLPKS